MLTKDFLKCRILKDKVRPTFLKITDNEQKLAGDLVDIFKASEGQRQCDVESSIGIIEDSLAPAFTKLLWDRTTLEDEGGHIREWRSQVFERAEILRKKFRGSAQEFRAEIATSFSVAPEKMMENLYSDLKEFRRIEKFKDITPVGLIHRYNCAQIQGLILQAKSVTVNLKGTTLSERRSFFRLLKFHRLFANVDCQPESKDLTVDLSGPMSLFQNAQAYGLRLAQFIPHILNLSCYSVEAEVRVRRRDVVLKFDQKCGIQSHYKATSAYLPPEISECLSDFQKKYAKKLGVTIEPNENFVHLGNQSYCFPDLKVNSGTEVLYIELFHRWHKGQLEHRTKNVGNEAQVALGVSQQLAKPGGVCLDKIPHFVFREFPTAGQLKTFVQSHASSH